MNARHVSLMGAAAVLLVLAGSMASGRVLAQSRLAAAKTVQCSMLRQATGTFGKAGGADAAVKTTKLVLRFESIDSDAGTASLRNGAMGADVTVRLTEGYLHFMQALRTGPLYTTTVFESGASGGKFKAVHSRHEYFTTPLPGATSSPEQYYGECEVVQ